MELLVFIISVLVSVVVGFVVLQQDPRKLTNQVYGLLTLSFIVLGIANYMSLNGPLLSALVYMRVTILATTIALAAVYFLVILLRSEHTNPLQQKCNVFIVIFTVIVACLDMSPWVFSGLAQATQLTPVPAIGMGMFIAHFLLLVIASFSVLFRGVARSRGVVRLQYIYILIGLVPTILFAPLTGVMLPIVFHETQYVFLTPLYAAFFVSMVAYAMIRHRLFDIRLAAVRSAAYIGVLLTLSAIYYALAYVLSLVIVDGNGSTGMTHVNPMSIAIALILAFLFQPIKHFFDKLTNGIFYRDNYNTDDFFARINRELNTTTDLRSLLQRAATEIGGTVKSEQSFFFVRYGDNRFMMAGAKHHKRLPLSEVAHIDTYVAEQSHQVIIADMLEETDPLAKLMTRHKLGIILPLKMSDMPIGYLFLGTPRSRNYTRRDIRLLETISDELAIAIQNALSIQDVEEINQTLQQRIDEATKELRRTNGQLQRLDATKDEFISMASHQLRTPLTSVKGYISMVLEGDAGTITDMQHKLLTEAFVSSERMVHLISDFLNVSRLQTGKFMLEQHAVDLVKVVDEEVDSLQTIAKSHDLKLKFKTGARTPILYIDEGKIRQVIMNFIDNAIYYSREFSTITISVGVDAGDVLLQVQDTGIGVPESEQLHLFTKFFRATNAQKQRPDGTGVGLFLAKKVIAAHGGSIVFHSVEGEGSTFGFRLPIKKLQSAPADKTNNL